MCVCIKFLFMSMYVCIKFPKVEFCHVGAGSTFCPGWWVLFCPGCQTRDKRAPPFVPDWRSRLGNRDNRGFPTGTNQRFCSSEDEEKNRRQSTGIRKGLQLWGSGQSKQTSPQAYFSYCAQIDLVWPSYLYSICIYKLPEFLSKLLGVHLYTHAAILVPPLPQHNLKLNCMSSLFSFKFLLGRLFSAIYLRTCLKTAMWACKLTI